MDEAVKQEILPDAEAAAGAVLRPPDGRGQALDHAARGAGGAGGGSGAGSG